MEIAHLMNDELLVFKTTLRFTKNQTNLQLVGSVEVLETSLNTDRHGLLTLTNPDTGTIKH